MLQENTNRLHNNSINVFFFNFIAVLRLYIAKYYVNGVIKINLMLYTIRFFIYLIREG